MSLRAILPALLLAFALACGGGGGGGSTPVPQPSAPAAPTQLTVSQGPGADSIRLTWQAPQVAFDGFELEARTGSDPFEKVHNGLIPNNYAGLDLTFASSAPDNTTYTFRLRIAQGALFSPYSNEASHTRGPNAPGTPTATYDWDQAAVLLTWNRNTTGSDGLRIERAECSSYGSVTGAWTTLPVPDPLVSTYLDRGATTGLYYTYRLTNLKGALAGPTSSQSAPAFAGLEAAQYITANYDSGARGVQVSWASSSQADGVLLERADYDTNGLPLGTWAALALPAGYRTSFLDQSIQEAHRYAYRVSNLRGQTSSAACQTYYLVWTPLFAPVGLQVVPAAGGLQLTWQNRSAAATQIVIRRTPSVTYSSDVAILSPDMTAYVDPIATLGYYTYTVVAKTASQEASSDAVVAATPNPPGSLALTATQFGFPSLADAALAPAGTWACATAQPFGLLSNSDPWPAYFPGIAARWSNPIVRLDRQGRPHMVYASATPGVPGSYTLIHAWFNGTAWTSENILTAQIPSTSVNPGWTFQLDSTGVPHLLVDQAITGAPYGGTTASLLYVHKTGSTWVQESLSSVSPAVDNVGSYHLALDASDQPRILLGNWGSLVACTRTAPGTWSTTMPPTGAVNAGWYDYLDILWADADNGWIFYESTVNAGGANYGLWVLQMKAGIWQAPQLLGTRAHDGSSSTAAAAISPDLSRVGITYRTTAGIKAYHQAPDGWHETLVGPQMYGPNLRIGFDNQQKVHILVPAASGYTDFHE